MTWFHIAAFGVMIHAMILARYVAAREPRTNPFAFVLIFFSGMWFIGPFAYFGFRRSRPLLATACLWQMFTTTLLWVAVIALPPDSGGS